MDIYENENTAGPQETPETESTRFEVTPPQEPWEEPKKKKGTAGKVAKFILIVLAVSLVTAACSSSVWAFSRLHVQELRTDQLLSDLYGRIDELEEELASKSFTGNGNSISGSDNSGTNGGQTPGQVYADVVKSVVAVTCETLTPGAGNNYTGITSSGTGFILTEDGYIVTNYHVVEGGTTLTVTAYDGSEYTAVLRGYDSTNDIAVLKVQAQGLPAVTLGSSDDLIVGDQVVVIGNPLGELTSTLTVGYISAKDRVITTDGTQINMLQTDAAVNSGNSGGPIFNMNGEVVGIITAKYSGTTNSGASIEGIGFAIPIDDVVSKISDLKEYGYITGAYLGVLVQDVDRDVAEYYGLPLGVYVVEAVEGYCAAAAGLQPKDIIIALGDRTVTGMNSLTRALQNFKAGDTTTITVWRGGLVVELEITLDERPH